MHCPAFTVCAFMNSVHCLQCVYHLPLIVCYPPLGLVSVIVIHLLGSLEPSSMNFPLTPFPLFTLRSVSMPYLYVHIITKKIFVNTFTTLYFFLENFFKP